MAPLTGTESREVAAADQFSESYRRDAEIAHSARKVLRLKCYMPGEQVPNVAVKNGWVTLWGEVEKDYKSQPAARAVFRLPGVQGVTDLIAVRRAATADPEDGLVAALTQP
jgi:osmotically-inducible protein OsmY